MTDAVDGHGRRLFLIGAAAASGLLLMGHSPYRRWSQYRALHTVIAADRTDAGSFSLGERLVAHLHEKNAELKPVAARAENAATVLSLLKTSQLDLGLLRAEDAWDAVHGAGARILGGMALNALAVLAPEYLYAFVAADSPIRGVQALRGARVAVVHTGGRTDVRARRLLSAAGVDPDEVRWTSVEPTDATMALSRGSVDAVVLESHSREPGSTLASSAQLRLLPHGDVVGELVARHGPVYFSSMPRVAAEGRVAVDGPVLAEARLLVCRADYAMARSRLVANALRGWHELASADTPLPIPRHAALADPETPS